MSWIWIVGGVVTLLLLLEAKRGRHDGQLVRRPHPYRRLMMYVMPSRNESIVYFESKVRAEALEAWLPAAREAWGAGPTHAIVAALAVSLSKNPKMNRFVSGRRMYRRNDRVLTFSMKRTKLDATSQLAMVRYTVQPGETFGGFCKAIDAKVHRNRSGETTSTDKEYAFFDVVPRFLLRPGQYVIRILDYYNILPRMFIDGDGMYCSCFIANLGSLGMDAPTHHLYEWGNCPLFLGVGATREEPIVEDGAVGVGRVMTLRWSYDERIADGLTARAGIDDMVAVLEDPARWLGDPTASGDGASLESAPSP
ncbi:MAG: 2-oxo acid dehydrogenase subunit E2 [Deltaproteobacteria bacterium]|nr:2-oxo acid dehydrogenase subunit E2 [Deltaproteobacteria bacterium]